MLGKLGEGGAHTNSDIMLDYIHVPCLEITVLNQKVRGFIFKISFQQSEVQYRKEMGKMEKQVDNFGAFNLY